MKVIRKVMIMAGGTGGHVFPGLALANYLRGKDIEVHWLGTPNSFEARVVSQEQIPLHCISISGVRGKGAKALVSAPFKISAAVLQAKHILTAIKPDIVIGMGGFASGPGGIASWLTRCPLVIHEQNAKAGLTNKILASVAKKVLCGFPESFTPRTKALTVGNPVRTEIENLAPPQARLKSRSQIDERFRLLVLGGSLGAQALNELVPKALARLAPSERPLLYHQTGEKHFDRVKSLYSSMGLEADIKPFIQDMSAAYAWADLVLCRAGALTVSELCAAGLGAIFVPFPHAVDDHQTANANFMVKHSAARCIQQSELTEQRLADIVIEFSRLPEARLQMAEAAYQLRKVKVTEKIFAICEEILS